MSNSLVATKQGPWDINGLQPARASQSRIQLVQKEKCPHANCMQSYLFIVLTLQENEKFELMSWKLGQAI